MLSDDRRKQLDGIVQQMVTNKESDSNVQFVVDDFKKKYESEQVSTGTQAAQPKKGILNTLEKVGSVVPNLALGAAKGIGSTLAGASSLGEKILLRPIDKLVGNDTSGPTEGEQIQNELLQPTNTAQKLGFLGEQIGEFFIPGGAITKLGKAAETSVKGSKLLKSAANLGVRSLGEGGLALGQTALQKGEIGQEAKSASLLSAVIPGAAKLGGLALKGIGKVSAGLAGAATGAKVGAIEEVFKNPNVIKFARQAGKDIEGFQDEVLQQTKSGLNKLREARAGVYQKQLEQIKLNPQELDNITSEVRDKAVRLLDQFDINPMIDEAGSKLNTLDFSKSTLVEGANVVEKAFNDVLSWTDNTPAGLDKLKRRLGSFSDQLSSREKAPAKYIVDQLKDSVNKGLQNNVKGYKEMTSGYAKTSNLIDEINSTLSLGNKKAKETSIKKIFGALRENNEQRKEMLKVLGESGGQDLVGKVAGAQLAQKMPRGLSGTLGPVAGGAAFIANPSMLPGLIAYATASSPRAVAEITNILGRVSDQMIKADKYSPEIQRLLREVIIKSQNSN